MAMLMKTCQKYDTNSSEMGISNTTETGIYKPNERDLIWM